MIISETIKLPISFILGVSFISGSLTGSLLAINIKDKKITWLGDINNVLYSWAEAAILFEFELKILSMFYTLSLWHQ